MQGRTPSSPIFAYLGTVAMAISVIALGLTAIVKASTGSPEGVSREKTLLDIQVESSREIRRALAVPVTIPPLPPITARLARDLRETALAQPGRRELPQEALNAMAMDQTAAYPEARPSSPSYPARDRHSASW